MNETLNPPQTCPNCGTVLEDNPTYCPRCGASLLPASAKNAWWRTCLAVSLLLTALPLGAFGGCLALIGGFGGTSSTGVGVEFYLAVAGILLLAALLFVAAIKLLKQR